jgi:hypothetical protein
MRKYLRPQAITLYSIEFKNYNAKTEVTLKLLLSKYCTFIIINFVPLYQDWYGG